MGAPARGSGAASRSGGTTGASPGPLRGTEIGSSAGIRRAQLLSPLEQLPSPASIALGFGAFIIPVDGGLHPLGLRAVGLRIASLLALPEFLREARANAQDGAAVELPDLQGVLGQQGTITALDDGGALTFGQLPLVALALVLLSSLLVLAAVLPPGVVAHTPVSAGRYDRIRQPLALAAIGILLPVAIVALATALS